MRWPLHCGTNDLKDRLSYNNKADRGGIQRATNREDGEEEPQKCEWSNDEIDEQEEGLGPVPFNRPGESR